MRLIKNVNMMETAVDLPVYTSVYTIHEAAAIDAHLQELKAYIIKGWLHKKEDVAQGIQKYWPSGMRWLW